MQDTLAALRTHLIERAPATVHLSAARRVHLSATCVPDARPVGPAAAVDAFLTSRGEAWCSTCSDGDWVDQVSLSAAQLPPDEPASDSFPDPLTNRAMLTPGWLVVDPLDGSPCCERVPPSPGFRTDQPTHLSWSGQLNHLTREAVHARLEALAARHDAPTTWVALPHRHLAPSVVRDTYPLAALTRFHPWAGLHHQPDGRPQAGLVLFHLPDDLARLALEHDGIRLHPAHVNDRSWPVARRLLANALEATSPLAATSHREDAVLAQVPHLLEVAHVATH